jgi:hypothetical protein
MIGGSINNCKLFEKKQSWPVTRYYLGINMKRVRKTTKAQIEIVGVSAEIRSWYLRNASQKVPVCTNFAGQLSFRPAFDLNYSK